MALRRRWYLVLVAVVVAVGACYGVVTAVGPTYETKGAVLILPPGAMSSDPSSTVGNPFLSLSGVSQARDVVIRTMMSKTFMEELCESSGDSEHSAMVQALCQPDPSLSFVATPDFTSSAPMIIITVEADSPANGGAALKAIAGRIPSILDDLQADLGLRKKALISSAPIVMDYQPDVVHKDQIRAGIVAGVGALGVGLLIVGLADGLVLRRRKARSAVDEQVGEDPEVDAGSDDTSAAASVEEREVSKAETADEWSDEVAIAHGDQAEDDREANSDAIRSDSGTELVASATRELDGMAQEEGHLEGPESPSGLASADQSQLGVADMGDGDNSVINLERTRRRSRIATQSPSSGSGG